MDDKKETPKEELDKASVSDVAPEGGVRKSMTDAAVILEKLADKEKLDPDEERLADLLTFHKTGKHLSKFKNPKPSAPAYSIPIISKDKSFSATTEEPVDKPARPELPISTLVIASGVPVSSPQGVS